MEVGLHRFWRGHPRVAVAIAAAAVAGLAWWWVASKEAVTLRAAGRAPAVLLAEAPPGAGPATSSVATTPADAAGPPEGLTAEQWRLLQAALKDDPRRQAELNRVADYMAFLSRLTRYRVLRSSGAGDLPQTQALARGLLDALPVHVTLGEMSAGEAKLVQDALLESLYPDDAERNRQREAQRRRLQQALPETSATVAAAALDSRYQQAQAAVVADWYGRPESQRDPRQLEASLDALRRTIFDAHTATPSSGGKP